MNISDVLLAKGLITPAQLAAAMELHVKESLRVDRALIRIGALSEDSLLKVMSEQFGVPVVDLPNITIDVETLRSLPAKLVYRKRLVPVGRTDGVLTVATADPFDLYAFDELRLLTGLEIRPVLASQEEIDKVIKAKFGVGGDTVDEMMSDDLEVVSETSGETEDLLEMAQEASVIKLVNEFFLEASTSGPATFTSNPTRTISSSATASTACCRRRPCRRRSSGSRPPSSAASRSCRT